MQEAGTGFASKPQTDDAEPGDIALDSWVRYDDPEVGTFSSCHRFVPLTVSREKSVAL